MFLEGRKRLQAFILPLGVLCTPDRHIGLSREHSVRAAWVTAAAAAQSAADHKVRGRVPRDGGVPRAKNNPRARAVGVYIVIYIYIRIYIKGYIKRMGENFLPLSRSKNIQKKNIYIYMYLCRKL